MSCVPFYTVNAQNLVPNFSFEAFNHCPKGFNSMNTDTDVFPSVDQWYNPNLGTADYFNTCGDELDSVPYNFDGFQYPHTGNAYCGIICYSDEIKDYREYIQVKLVSALEAGRIYCVQFYVSNSGSRLLDTTAGLLYFQSYAINSLGAYFSKDRISNYVSGNATILNAAPQVLSDKDSMLADTAKWTLISGLYFAKGGEQYLTLGNFTNDLNLTKKLIAAGNGHESYALAYYFIDDVFVVPTDIIFKHLGDDTTLCDDDSLVLDIANPLATGYQWQDGTTNPVYVVHIPNEYYAKVFFGDCGSIIDSIRVNYVSPPHVFLGPDTSVCDATPFSLSGSVEGTAQYLWQDGSNKNFFIAITSGSYWLKMSNQCGNDADTIDLDFVNCDCRPIVPNAFSPNGDGINDEMRPIMECNDLRSYTFKAFNRWGELMFETNDVNKGWNGNYKNKPVEIGTYVYSITYSATIEDQSLTKIKTGNFILLR